MSKLLYSMRQFADLDWKVFEENADGCNYLGTIRELPEGQGFLLTPISDSRPEYLGRIQSTLQAAFNDLVAYWENNVRQGYIEKKTLRVKEFKQSGI